MKKTILAVAALFALPASANAALIINGDFETGPSVGNYTTLNAGSGALTGWTVGGNSIDYIGSYWTAHTGGRSLDMSGNGAGSISQSFATLAGITYNVSFWIAGNPDSAGIKTLSVDVGGAQTDFTFNSAGKTRSAMGWEQKFYSFVATGSSTTLTFTSKNASAYGPALDDIEVSAAVPEPASWAMMIGGLALVGGQMRRRRTAVSFA